MLVAVLAVAGVVSLICVQRAVATPPWWSPPDARDPAVAESARAVERGVSTLAHRALPAPSAPSDNWTLRISEDDANAWLATRLPEWLANQHPGVPLSTDAGPVQARFGPSGVTLGVAHGPADTPRVFSVSGDLHVQPDGSIWVRAQSAALGRLPLPASLVLDLAAGAVGEHSSGEFGRLVAALKGDQPLARDPVFTLADGRRVRVLAIAVEDGAMLVTCRTEGVMR